MTRRPHAACRLPWHCRETSFRGLGSCHPTTQLRRVIGIPIALALIAPPIRVTSRRSGGAPVADRNSLMPRTFRRPDADRALALLTATVAVSAIVAALYW